MICTYDTTIGKDPKQFFSIGVSFTIKHSILSRTPCSRIWTIHAKEWITIIWCVFLLKKFVFLWLLYNIVTLSFVCKSHYPCDWLTVFAIKLFGCRWFPCHFKAFCTCYVGTTAFCNQITFVCAI